MNDLSSFRLAGAPNFRDLGGYATRDNRVVKRGFLFRSGDSALLTAADIAQVRALGVKLIVDLRSKMEIDAVENRWPTGGTEFIAANILADLRAGNRALFDILADDPTPRGAGEMMEAAYRALPHALGPTICQIVRSIAEEDKLPLIFHCSVGRDRTGITAAMLLHALGVPRDTVIADYLRTNVHIDAAAIREIMTSFMAKNQTKLDEETFDIITFARIEHLHAAFRTVAVEYGTPDGYLRAIGIDAIMQERLRDRLLEPA